MLRTGKTENSQKFGNNIWMNLRVTHASQSSVLCTWTSRTMFSCCLIFCLACLTNKIPRNGSIWKRLLWSFYTVLWKMSLKLKAQKLCKSGNMQWSMTFTRQCSIDFTWFQNNQRDLKSIRLWKRNKFHSQPIWRKWLPKKTTNWRLSRKKVSATETTVRQIKNGTSLANKKQERKFTLRFWICLKYWKSSLIIKCLSPQKKLFSNHMNQHFYRSFSHLWEEDLC